MSGQAPEPSDNLRNSEPYSVGESAAKTHGVKRGLRGPNGAFFAPVAPRRALFSGPLHPTKGTLSRFDPFVNVSMVAMTYVSRIKQLLTACWHEVCF